MGEWKTKFKHQSSAFRTLKKLFEAHAVEKMFDINEIHSSKVSDALGINKGRYATKLANPETFSTFEILRFAWIIDIDPTLVIEVIQNEKNVMSKIVERVNRNTKKKKTNE
ncbi:hypothetical protein [Arachidicoccus sp.]|uniref:hypothetical protein n=1 Tax=Arachidicoccus sp. TaxID=1872624 RepID=UPI003D1AC598